MPKISIIVPAYNSEKDLPKCLDSLVGQTLCDIEIIVVNDGSTDGSQAVIEEYSSRYPHLIKSFSQENRGQSAARNFALERAVGEFLFFVDSDDYIDLDTCEKTYKHATENDLDILCFNFWNEKDGERTFCDHCHMKDVEDVDKKYVLNESSPCNKIIRRSVLTDNGLKFLENYIYEDLELMPRLALYTKKIGYIEDAFYHYVMHEGSTMNQKKYSKKLHSIYYVMDSLKKHLQHTEYAEELEYLYIEHLMYFTVFRYLDFPEGVDDAKKIADIMRKEFPRFRKNKYYKRKNFKQKVFLELVYAKQIALLKFLLKK